MTDRPPGEPTRQRHGIPDLLAVMAALRTPGSGCPWDLEQTFASIAPYTIEEAYEVADAIARGDLADLEEELGDLLLQVVYHARMAEETGAFAFADVVDTVARKMIRRHPHVFGTAEERAAGAQPGFWSRIKAAEKAEKATLRERLAAAAAATVSPDGSGSWFADSDASGASGEATDRVTPAGSLLDDVPSAMPALMRAIKLQDKAAKVGFDWPSLAPVFDKMREELDELAEVALPLDPRRGDAGPAAPSGASRPASQPASQPASRPSPREDFGKSTADAARIEEEFGDLLFVMANVARHLGIDAEAALRGANHKFVRRFHHIERRLADQGSSPAASTLADMDALWDEAKRLEKQTKPA